MIPYILVVAEFVVVNFLLTAPAAVSGAVASDLELKSEVLGILGSAFVYAYAVVQIPVGFMVDRQGIKRTITLSLLLIASGAFMLALASSFPMALAGRTISGLGGGMVPVPLLGIISHSFRANKFATLWGIANAVGFGLGTFLSTAPLVLATARWGWRMPFIVATVVCMILFGLVHLLFKEPGRSRHPDNYTGSAASSANPLKNLRSGFRLWLGERTLWAFSLVLFLSAGSFLSFQALWAGPYGRSVLGLREAALGRFLLMIPVGLIVGFVVAGAASDWMQNRKRLVLAGCLGYSILWMVQAASVAGATVLSPYVAVTGMGVLYGLLMVGYGLIPVLIPEEKEGLVTGIVNTSPFLGSAAFQVMTGFVVRPDFRLPGRYGARGFVASFSLLAVAAVAASGASALMRETKGAG